MEDGVSYDTGSDGSNLKDRLRQVNYRWWLTDNWSVYYHEESDGLCLIDGGGQWATHRYIEELIEGLQDFIDNADEDELIRANERVQQRRREEIARRRSEEQPPPKRKRRAGYIYILYGNGYYKIGKTNDINRRLDQIKPALPFEIKLIHTMRTDDTYLSEKIIHYAFDPIRANGEWFNLTHEQLKLLKSYSEFGFDDMEDDLDNNSFVKLVRNHYLDEA